MSRPGLLRSTAVFSAMTLLSRVAGLARDLLQATLFGAGPAVSAFVVAYRIPNYLRRVFAEGSFSSAFVPVLSELRQKGDEAALKDFVDHVAGALLSITLNPLLFRTIPAIEKRLQGWPKLWRYLDRATRRQGKMNKEKAETAWWYFSSPPKVTVKRIDHQ